ncbi:MAG: hypothetical protein K1X57_15350 [Gemmataceae bacterium]|nr:hypothetical protein [Gemmataceae bacterium]
MLPNVSVIPFLAKDVESWLALMSTSFFVKDEWHFWYPFPGGLQKLAATPSEGNYFGDKPERSTDILFPYLQLMAQHIACESVMFFARGIDNDFHSLAASLGKLKLIFGSAAIRRSEVRRFVETEIEYILMVCRSMFDLLQELIQTVMGCVVSNDVKRTKRQKQLPKSFAKMVEKENRALTGEEIQKAYDLQPPIAQWYAEQAEFFLEIRRIRNRLVHSGESPTKSMFVIPDRGFAISLDRNPFGALYSWPKGCEAPNELVPLRPVIARIVWSTLRSFNSFAVVFRKTIQLPSEIAPGLNYFMRGYNNIEILELQDIVDRALWDVDQANLENANATIAATARASS